MNTILTALEEKLSTIFPNSDTELNQYIQLIRHYSQYLTTEGLNPNYYNE